MTTLDLTDTLAIAPSDRLMVKTVPEADFPQESNTAYKAAVAMGKRSIANRTSPSSLTSIFPSAQDSVVRPPTPLRLSWVSAAIGVLTRVMNASMPWLVPSAPMCRSSSTGHPPTWMDAEIA